MATSKYNSLVNKMGVFADTVFTYASPNLEFYFEARNSQNAIKTYLPGGIRCQPVKTTDPAS